MISKPLKKIRSLILKYLAIIYASVGVVLFISIAVLSYTVVRATHDEIKINDRFSLNLTKELIGKNIEMIYSDLRFLAKQNELLSGVDALNRQYLEFSRQKKIYDQIRFINARGMEVSRVNYNKGTPAIAARKDLQSKTDRYYFKETMSLDHDEIFVSPFDLNIEQGKIEKPLKPVIRFGIPVLNKQGRREGIVVLNYLGSILISRIKAVAKNSPGEVMLINTGGYWLCAQNPGDEWGFMYEDKKQKIFQGKFPGEWEQLKKTGSGQIESDNGLFSIETIYPLGKNGEAASTKKYNWKLVSYISKEVLSSETKNHVMRFVLLGIGLFLIAGIPSYLAAQSIVKRKLYRLELYFSANYDKLTSLPNRTLFMDRMDQMLKQGIRYQRKFALFFIDLDGFKDINDTLGHDAGDAVLIVIGERLYSGMRSADTVGRIGGDEFTMILSGLEQEDDHKIVAQKIIEEVGRPIMIKGEKRIVGVSIGISIFSGTQKETVDSLLKKADDAMYQAKDAGKNTFRVYE
ncbi:MAG: diguanylate cyclase [Desulfobacteraceae bacterium]|nr:diguanylate cyclase [Desulfobacteraceae bacterium]